jgi:hypothetical protein
MAQISMVRAFLGASFGSETGKSSTGAGFQSLFNSTHLQPVSGAVKRTDRHRLSYNAGG